MYIELHSRSAFSFLEGASLPENSDCACAKLNMPAMALLDRDGVYGSPRFHMAAKKAGIKAHIGSGDQLRVLFAIERFSNSLRQAPHESNRNSEIDSSEIRQSAMVFSSSSSRLFPLRISEPLPPDYEDEAALEERRRRGSRRMNCKNMRKALFV